MELDLNEFETLLNECLDKPEPDPEGTDNEELKEEVAEEDKVSYEEELKEVAEEVKAEIEKIYGDDDLMEYFVVETHVGKYDDGTPKYSIEVRGELGYEAMTDLAIKLDPIVQQYDKYAYFDMVDGGIMETAIEFNRQPYIAPFRIVIKATDIEEDILYYDTLEEAKDICAQILNGSKKDEIIKLSLEKLEDGEYKLVQEFKGLVQESVNADIATVVNIPLVTEKLYNKLVNLLYGNKKGKNRDYEQQQNVLNFLQEIEDRIPLENGISIDLEDYSFTEDEIDAIKKIVRDERVEESLKVNKSVSEGLNLENDLTVELVANIKNDITDLTSTAKSLVSKFKEYAPNWDHEKQWSFCERIQEILQGATINLENVSKRIK